MASNSEFLVARPADDDEVRAFVSCSSQALFFPGAHLDEWIERERVENIRVVHRHGRFAGGLTRQDMGQWFGGRSVPMVAIRMVGIAPEHRGVGACAYLMGAVLSEIHQDGFPISMLYPATQPVYRRSGYEQGGMRIGYRLPAATIDLKDRGLNTREIQSSDHDAIREVYATRAARTSGNLDRSRWVWDRVLDPLDGGDQRHGYLVERDGRVEGYVVYAQVETKNLSQRHRLDLADLVAVTPDAARRLWTTLADHRSTVETITWYGAPAEPMLYLLAEQRWTIFDRIDWMLRIVDVAGALEARGYSPGLRGEVHFEVSDDVLTHNNGRYILEVSDSRGQVREGGSGGVKIDVRGLASLYTGRISPAELKTIGYAEGSDADLATAGIFFAGPAPWMPDIC